MTESTKEMTELIRREFIGDLSPPLQTNASGQMENSDSALDNLKYRV